MRILIAEDDRDLNEIIVRSLAAYAIDIDECYDGLSALEKIDKVKYDVVVLDIMMPGKSGLEVVHAMRADGNNTPVLFLTAMDAIEDRVNGLDAGADDYLTKPFALEEFAARVRALARRHSEPCSDIYQIANLKMDLKQRLVTRGDQVIELSKREFSILEYLMRNAGIVLTREQIEQQIWNLEYTNSSNILDVYISNLRRKVDADYEPKLIHTVRSVGYTMREKYD